MPSLARRRRIRWAAPVAVAGAIGLLAFLPTLSAGADTPTLAPLTSKDVLVKIQQADVQAPSGQIRLTTNLGIPNLSSLADAAGHGSAGFNPVDYLSGSHDAHIWVDGPERQRVQLASTLAETDVIHNGTDVWTWQSDGHKVEHLQGVTGQGTAGKTETPATVSPATESPATETPAQLAASVLADIDPSTTVQVTTPAYVADQPVFELDVAPRSADSTVSHVAIAVDAHTGLVLRVSIYAKGQHPVALELGFIKISYHRPAASNFTFHPPSGATVTTKTVGPKSPSSSAKADTGSSSTQSSGTKVVGTDWTQVVISHTSGPLPRQADIALRAATPVHGAFGSGNLFHTALVNVLLLDDGRIAAGAVNPTALEAAVASAQ